MYDYDQPVNVQGYDPTLGSKSYRTVSGAVLYDHPITGARYHLVIHQAVEIPTLKYHLVRPI